MAIMGETFLTRRVAVKLAANVTALLAVAVDLVLGFRQADSVQVLIAVDPSCFRVDAHLQPRLGVWNELDLHPISHRIVGARWCG